MNEERSHPPGAEEPRADESHARETRLPDPEQRRSDPGRSLSPRLPDFVGMTLGFEIGLIAIAVLVGEMIGRSPMANVTAGGPVGVWEAALFGAFATIPMAASLLFIDRCPVGPLKRLSKLVDERVVPLFATATVGQMAALAVAAGIGEELLFRGLIQGGLADWLGGRTGQGIALAVASLAFGLCHWLSATYAALATVIGIYLGVLLLVTDNVLAPVVTHALYDFFALLYLVHRRQPQA